MCRYSMSSIVLIVSTLAIAAHCTSAFAQIEFANSTVRLKSATEPDAPLPLGEQPQDADQSSPPPEPSQFNEDSDPPPLPLHPVRRHAVRPAQVVVPASTQPVAVPTARRAPSRVGVYSSTTARATLSKIPRPAPVHVTPAAPARRPRGKPFQSVPSQPTISPYLGLNRTDADADNLPNYFAFVRPQVEQQEASRQQAAELQKLRTQVQNLSSAAAGGPPAATSRVHARYMDTAQFYRGMGR